MSFDINGRDPDCEVGEYQRFSAGWWKPMHDLIKLLCEDILDPDLLVEMGWNSGAGPTRQATCDAMADRFQEWLRTNHNGFGVDNGKHLSNADIEEWVEFLRHCGGFRVS